MGRALLKGLGLAGCLLMVALWAKGEISGSAHDFRSSSWSSDEICEPCHTPHNADTTVAAPLWNHEVTGSGFQVYNSPTMDVPVGQPRGISLLCLSCHDGVTALGSFGDRTDSTTAGGSALIGVSLTDDHPISIEWNHQTDVWNGPCGNCHNQQNPGLTESVLPFCDGYLECATCHDPHNGTGYQKFLRKPLSGSQLCLHCHGK